MTQYVISRPDFHSALTAIKSEWQQEHGSAPRIGVVLTMGALHAGHGALLTAAREECDIVVATIYVNPLQFGDAADLERYPHRLIDDLAIADEHRVDLVWGPTFDDVYSGGQPVVTLSAGQLGRILEGEARPGHFDGMLTVVGKFLNIINPERAYFGEKDYQQLAIIRRMVSDLDLTPAIIGVPTVRERDGLALSSRNIFLSDAERAQALSLSRALAAGRDAAPEGPDAVISAASGILAGAGINPDYLELRALNLDEATEGDEARLLVAAKLGATRLIDNVGIAKLGG